MAKKALIFATTYFPMVGGAEVAVRELTDRLQDWEFELVCAKLDKRLTSSERLGRVRVHRVGFGRPFDKYLLPLFGTVRALQLRFSGRFDFFWAIMASYGGFTALVYSYLQPWTPFVLTLQEGDPLERYDERAGIFAGVHRRIFQRAHVVHAISRFLAEWAERMGSRSAPVVIPNGVDIARFSVVQNHEAREALRTRLGFAQTDTVLVTASRLSLKNGVDDVIRALGLLPMGYRLLVIGDGEDRASLEQLTRTLSLEERIVFLGRRSHDELPALLKASDIFVRPSLSEGLGNAFLEAMAAGLPVIGTPVGGIPDFLQDGETGLFCEPRKPESIAYAVHRYADPSLRSYICAKAAALVVARYDWATIAEEFHSLFERAKV